MFFPQIKHNMPIGEFQATFPHIKINLPQQKDYDASMWPDMQHKSFATFHEPTAAGDLLYQLTFREGVLISLHISFNGDFQKDTHQAISAIAGQIVTAQSSRGVLGAREIAPLLAWKELIESPLPDSGRPDERYIPVFSAKWQNAGWSIELNYTWTWPGQLYLQYREEQN